MRVTDQGDPGDRRPASASTSRCISADRATPFSRSGSPVFARSKTGVQPAPASASAYVVPTALAVVVPVRLVLAEAVQQTTTRPVASGKAAASPSGVGRDVAPVGAHRHRDRQLGPLPHQPVADQPVDRGVDEPAAAVVLQPGAEPGRGACRDPSRRPGARGRARRRPHRRCRGAPARGDRGTARWRVGRGRGPGRPRRGGCRGRCATTSSSATSESSESGVEQRRGSGRSGCGRGHAGH